MSQLKCSPCTDQVLPKQSKKGKLVSARAANQKHDYRTLENQPESFINEAISLISIDAVSVNLIGNGEPNNFCIHLARDGHLLSGSTSKAEVVK